MVKASIPLKLTKLTRRAADWVPWLAISVVVTGLLLHGTSVSAMMFQSPASPVQPTTAPTETPIPEPTLTPIPPVTKPAEAAPVPTDTPVPQPTEQPQESAPSGEVAPPTPTAEGGVPSEIVEPAVTEAIPPETPETEVPPATEAAPAKTPVPAGTPQPTPGGRSQSIVNWTKFWDTLAVWVAYPWLCCGIGLLLLVPAVMLYLEIMGRRRPQTTPERLPERGVPPRRRSPSKGGRSAGE